MLDKKKSGLMIKIVALFIAISFAASLVPFLLNTNQNSQPQPQQQPLVNEDPVNSQEQIQGLMAQADFNFENQNYDQSALFYDQVILIDSENVDAKSGLGASKVLSGNSQEGFDLLNQVISVNPEHAGSQYFLAVSSKNLGNNEQARTSYQKYLELEPEGKHAEDAKNALSELNVE